MEGFLGKEIVTVMENATSGTEGNNHINILTGLKFSLFKEKTVNCVKFFNVHVLKLVLS